MDRNDERMNTRLDTLSKTVQKLSETAQLNFDRLTTAMLGLTEHVTDHRRRIERLER
jgi:hypothetical protein